MIEQEEDLVIGESVDCSGNTEAPEEVDVDFELTPDSACTYAQAAISVYSSTLEIDVKILSKADETRVNQIRRWSLRIAHHWTKAMFEETFAGDEKPEDEQN